MVTLDPTNLHAVPAELRPRIESGLDRIRAVRDSIAADAKVKLMPSVVAEPVIWLWNGHPVYAAATVLAPAFGNQIGVTLSLPPVLCEDLRQVRRLLVHEFSHCFMMATRAIDQIDAATGRSVDLTTGNPLDAKRELELLADPANWFGDADFDIPNWDDEALNTAMMATLERLVDVVPATTPPQRVNAKGVIVPPEWGNHVRRLRAAR